MSLILVYKYVTLPPLSDWVVACASFFGKSKNDAANIAITAAGITIDAKCFINLFIINYLCSIIQEISFSLFIVVGSINSD